MLNLLPGLKYLSSMYLHYFLISIAEFYSYFSYPQRLNPDPSLGLHGTWKLVD